MVAERRARRVKRAEVEDRDMVADFLMGGLNLARIKKILRKSRVHCSRVGLLVSRNINGKKTKKAVQYGAAEMVELLIEWALAIAHFVYWLG